MRKTENTKTTNNQVLKDETKVVVKSTPKFDLKAFGQTLQEKFKDSDTVDLVFDTDMNDGPRALNENDYRYMHIFRKGTTKNCFQLYTSSKGCEFVVGKSIDALITANDLFTRKEIIKAGKLSHIVYISSHDNAAAVLTELISAYKEFNAQKAAVLAQKQAEAEAKKAERAAKKAEKPAEEKPVTKKTKKVSTKKVDTTKAV